MTKRAEVLKALAGVDVVYHLAAVSSVNAAYRDPLGCVEANIVATANVLESARINHLHRGIFASTVWVYQASPDATPDETSCFAPGRVGHVYTASKIAGEMLCQSYQRLYGLPFTILRYGTPFGPFMRQELLIPTFIRTVLAGEPLTINGDGSQYRKFIYVEDLARGNVAALAPQAENRVYNLEGTQKVTTLDVARAIGRLLGHADIRFGPARPGDLQGIEVDCGQAMRDLGWQPSVAFDEGLRRTVAWYLALPEPSLPHPAARVPS